MPCDKDNEAVAKALEYAYDDWCISVLAGELGDTLNQRKYADFSKGYQNYFDPVTRFMRGLDSKGNWRTRSIPALPTIAVMTIVRGLPGNGPGLFLTMWRDWWN